MSRDAIRETEPTRFLAVALWAWLVQAFLLCLTGVALGVNYRATLAEGHADVERFHEGGVWRFVQSFHYWGSATLLVTAVVTLIATYALGGYGRERRWSTLAALAAVVMAFAFQLSGNVLPVDRHGVQTAAIESGIMSRAPAFGPLMEHVMDGGAGMNAETIGRWYGFHRLLPFGVVLVGVMIWLGFRESGRVRASMGLILPAVTAVLAAVVASPLGSAATNVDLSSFDAKVSWYTLPFHASMSMFDALVKGGGWIGAMVVPGLLAVALVASAFVPSTARWPRWAIAGASVYFFIAIVGWGGGSVASLVGTRDPVVSDPLVKPSGPKTRMNALLASKGRAIFNDTCAPCHGQDGRNGEGGPSLASVDRRHSDADYFMRYIKDPKSVKPSSTMPGFHDMPDADRTAIAEFLRNPH